ncbi:MAG: hypothetical protein K2P75_07735 [Sphingobacteriaceae bacterium]|jgi:hypothetical protein|nr:hypothetical protein [Sphingobacteriaceae bacterium]
MRKIILFLFLFFSTVIYSYAQEFPNLKNIKLNKKSHFKSAEPEVIKLVNYLFETPIDTKNHSRKEAGEFLIKWMNGTPDYVFVLEDKETVYFNTDADLMLIYMASLTKFMLENKSEKNQNAIILGAMKLALTYLNQQENKKKWSALLWQLNDANLHGKLTTFLNQ